MDKTLERLLDRALDGEYAWSAAAIVLGVVALAAIGRALLKAKHLRIVIEYIASDK